MVPPHVGFREQNPRLPAEMEQIDHIAQMLTAAATHTSGSKQGIGRCCASYANFSQEEASERTNSRNARATATATAAAAGARAASVAFYGARDAASQP